MSFVPYSRALLSREVFRSISHPTFDALLREIDNRIDEGELYGGISNRDALLLFVWYMKTASSFRNMEESFGYPHSNYKNTFGKIGFALEDWVERQLECRTNPQYRHRIVRQFCPRSHREFWNGTVILDGVHIPLERCTTISNFNGRFHSYKLHRPAWNVQVAITHDDIITYVSDPRPASVNDISMMAEFWSEFKLTTLTGSTEKVVVDKGYQGLSTRYHVPSISPFKKPRGRALSVEKIQHNQEVERLRRKVEGVFGDIKSTFKIMHHPFRHDGSPFKAYRFFRLLCAVHNNERRIRTGANFNY